MNKDIASKSHEKSSVQKSTVSSGSKTTKSRSKSDMIKQTLKGKSYPEQKVLLKPDNDPFRTENKNSEAVEIARTGLKGSSSLLNNREKYYPSLGKSVDSVRSFTGSEAKNACNMLGVKGYSCEGNIVTKDSNPSSKILDHEVFHATHQKNNSSNNISSANSNSDYEKDANAFAKDNKTNKDYSSIPGLLYYTETDVAGEPFRISDDGKMASKQESPVYGSHHLWAKDHLIKDASDKLQKQSSHLKLESADPSMETTVPNSSKKETLKKVKPTNTKNKTSGTDKKTGMKLPDDCGTCAQTIMMGKGRKTKAVYKRPEDKKNWWDKVVEYVTNSKTKTTSAETYSSVGPSNLKDKIFRDVMNMDADKAWEEYLKLSDDKKEEFDKIVGINKYASPEVGEAFSIVSSKDELAAGEAAWNFHWGAVVMKSGSDLVTCENFQANEGENAEWDFQMYGPPTKAGQTFHEQQKKRISQHGVDEYGKNPTTIKVKPK